MNENVARVMAENGYYGSVEDKPDTEKELFYLQDEFFEKRKVYQNAIKEWIKDTSKPKPVDGSIEPWSKMLAIIYSYACSLVKKSTKGKKYIDPDDVSDKGLEAAFRFMSSYNRKPSFAIGASFAGNLRWKVIEVMHEDKVLSLNQPTSYDAQLELLDTISDDSYRSGFNVFINYDNPEDMLMNNVTTIEDVLTELDEEVGSNSKIALLARLYLLINLRVPRTRHIKRLFLENWAQEYKTEQLLESTVLEVYNRYGKYACHNYDAY